MNILQISDLHITENFNLSNHSIIINKIIQIINEEIQKNNEIYLVCCGDIINMGNKELYVENAEKLSTIMTVVCCVFKRHRVRYFQV